MTTAAPSDRACRTAETSSVTTRRRTRGRRELSAYFARWLAFLGVDEQRYDELVQHIGGR